MEFTLNTKISASAEEIYNAWLSSDCHSKMTGGKATTSNIPGDSFTAWDDYIHGKNLVLEPNKRIVQSWRTAQFLENEEDSQIEVILNEVDGHTELTLNHTNVPESSDHYITGWDVHYFQPMKAYFSK